MTIAQEMFRFVVVREAERAALNRIGSRLIRDGRAPHSGSLLVTLYGPGGFEAKLAAAESYAKTAEFVTADDLEMLALGPAIDFFRQYLTTGIALTDLATDLAEKLPFLAALLDDPPSANVLEATARFLGRVWDSLYAQTIIGCDRYVSTNYLADTLRVYQVLRLLWVCREQHRQTWSGGGFDDYDVLIDLDRAAAPAATAAAAPDGIAPAAPVGIAAAASGSGGGSSDEFRVPLTVGAVVPPSVGDLILVEQDLQGYTLGELAEIASIMQGERREHSVRTLARTSQTTTTETSTEQDQTNSLTTDERFQLSSQAQQAASDSVNVQAGVSVSGKFGPVQVGASVNASYNTAHSTSQSTAQDYAKTVTEEATKRVQSSIKQTSSVTVLTQTQSNLLRGFNNEKGTTNVNGLYRWVDKIYTARLMNYGRRLMFSLRVPEPAAFFRGLLAQQSATLMGDLAEPVHPSRIGRASLQPLPDSDTNGGFRSFQDLNQDNYGQLAARYDVTDLEPPPPEYLTGSKAIVYPDAMTASKVDEHDHRNDLSYVSADNSVTVDASYRLTDLGVYAPIGGTGGFRSYADVLKIGEDKNEPNTLLVQVGTKSFHLVATGQGGDNPPVINTNFNEMQSISNEEKAFGDVVSSTLPVTVSANFEGLLTLTVVYKGYRRDEALDAWKEQTFGAILEGYTAQKQAYDQDLAVAQAKSQSATDAQTYELRTDQYRSIELTELKHGCIDLLTEGTAAGHTSIAIAEDETPTIVYDEADATGLPGWRSPLANGAVADFFERAFAWADTTYQFSPYYWADAGRWKELSQASAADPIFEQFLRAGSASVLVPVEPGYERSVLLFRATGRTWAGGYLPLFSTPEMLDVYADVELGQQLDPPEQIGEPWEIQVPTSLVMLQDDDTLPTFPTEPPAEFGPAAPAEPEPTLDAGVPF